MRVPAGVADTVQGSERRRALLVSMRPLRSQSQAPWEASGSSAGEIARSATAIHLSAWGAVQAPNDPRTAAAATGITLLHLDTGTGSPAEHLYRSAGWTRAGTIPDYALSPAGELRSTTLYYKRLGG